MENASEFLQSNTFNLYLLPLLIFLARIVDVTVGTFRIVMVSKGNKYLAPFLGFIEVTIWIIAIGKIMENLDNYINIAAYAAGFATGNYIGLLIEEKIAMGVVRIQIITAKPANQLLIALNTAGYGITHHKATGKQGEVSILYSIINRTEISKVTRLISIYNPNAFYSIEDVKFVNKKVNSIFSPQGHSRTGK